MAIRMESAELDGAGLCRPSKRVRAPRRGCDYSLGTDMRDSSSRTPRNDAVISVQSIERWAILLWIKPVELKDNARDFIFPHRAASTVRTLSSAGCKYSPHPRLGQQRQNPHPYFLWAVSTAHTRKPQGAAPGGTQAGIGAFRIDCFEWAMLGGAPIGRLAFPGVRFESGR
jgi:hypothetical protein